MKAFNTALSLACAGFIFILIAVIFQNFIEVPSINHLIDGEIYFLLLVYSFFFASVFFTISAFDKKSRRFWPITLKILLSVFLLLFSFMLYFSMYHPNIRVPEKCTLTTGFSCDNYKVTTGNVTMEITNDLERGIIISSINVKGLSGTGKDGLKANCTTDLSDAYLTAIPKGNSSYFYLDCGPDFIKSKRKAKAEIEVIYFYADSSPAFNHTVTGEMMAKVMG